MGTEEAFILSPADVGSIRRYVRHKYAGLPQEQHAEIVADALHRTIMRQLPEFAEETKRRITSALIRRTLLMQKRPIGAEDVLHMCMSEDWRSPAELHLIHQWINKQLDRDLDQAAVVSVLEQYSGAGNPLLQGSSHILWEQLKAAAGITVAPGPVSEAEIVPLHPQDVQSGKKLRSILYGLLSLFLIASMTLYSWKLSVNRDAKSSRVDELNNSFSQVVRPLALSANELPAELQYHTVDTRRLKDFLRQKSSLLAETPYLEAIVSAAEDHNIHPLLLFAITGQEQGFVPATHKSAKLIANNPFNVFHSWKEYNTTIAESADIAAQTIVHWSEDRPEGEDAIQWINRNYAQDPQWYKGVNSILASMKRYVEAESTP